MIITYMGTPGSGKTYEAMKIIITNLRTGRKIYTNIDGCNDASCREGLRLLTELELWDFESRFIYLKPEQVFELWKHVSDNAFIVIDEVHEFFGNRDWDTQKNKDFIVWAKKHRHYGFDLLMCTTNIDGVDKQVRGLSQWTYDFRKTDYFGRLLKGNYELAAHVGEYTGGKPFKKWFRRYDKNIFHCYKSYITDDIKELNLNNKSVNVLMHPVILALPVILIFAIYMTMHSSLFGGGFLGKKNISKITNVVSQPVVSKSLPVKDGVVKVPDKNMFVSRVVELRDLVRKGVSGEGNASAAVSRHPVNPDGGNSNRSGCRVSGRIVDSDGKVISLSECGDRFVERVGDEIVHVGKVRSGSRHGVLENSFLLDNNSKSKGG